MLFVEWLPFLSCGTVFQLSLVLCLTHRAVFHLSVKAFAPPSSFMLRGNSELFKQLDKTRIVSSELSPWYSHTGWLGVKYQLTYLQFWAVQTTGSELFKQLNETVTFLWWLPLVSKTGMKPPSPEFHASPQKSHRTLCYFTTTSVVFWLCCKVKCGHVQQAPSRLNSVNCGWWAPSSRACMCWWHRVHITLCLLCGRDKQAFCNI